MIRTTTRPDGRIKSIRPRSLMRLTGVIATSLTIFAASVGVASAEPEGPENPPAPATSLLQPDSGPAPDQLPAPAAPESAQVGGTQVQSLISRIRSRATGACIDDSLAYGLRALPCNGLSFQNWRRIQGVFAEFDFFNLATGRCLDHSSLGLRAVDCNGSGYQDWVPQNRGNGLQIHNNFTLACLDDSGLGLRAIGCNNGQFQRWDLN